MKQSKNFLVGFLVSFVGSIPLGYLNIVGFQMYQKLGIESLIFFILGIISIEAFVIYFTLIFAKRLSENQKLTKYIEIFGIAFMFLLSIIFYFQANHSNTNQDNLSKYINYSPFIIGIILNCFNFMQLPFWTSWNLYLLNRKFILIENNLKYFYVIGTLLGIFLGMLALILGLNLIATNFKSISNMILSVLIPLFFLAMAIFQSYKYLKKYY
jgi:hypothetical protein